MKVGIDSSAVQTTHDYKLSGISGSAKAVSTADAGTVFDAAGAAAAAQAASQPFDGTLTAFAALTIAANSLTIGSGADAFSQVTFAANTFPARASTGNLVAKTLSDFALTFLDDSDAAAVRTTIGAGTSSFDGTWSSLTGKPTLDVITAPAADVSLNSHRITNLATPTASGDAATKSYVDLALAEIAEHQEVKCATTVALTELSYTNNGGVGDLLTLVTGILLIDGRSLSVNDRVLIKNQAAPAHNGIWVVQTVGAIGVSTVFVRATDFDQESDGLAGGIVFVQNGTVNDDTRWVCSVSGVVTWGTTALNWSQFLGGVYSADESTLHLSGTTFSVLKVPNTLTLGSGLGGTSFDGSGNVTATVSYGTPGASAPGDVAAAGSANTAARSDHVHSREDVMGPSSQPTGDQTAPSYSQIYLADDPYVLTNGDVTILAANSLLWLDSTAVITAPLQFTPQTLEPTLDTTLIAGTTTEFDSDPLILDSGRLMTLQVNSLLWGNAASCPTTIHTLLILGV